MKTSTRTIATIEFETVQELEEQLKLGMLNKDPKIDLNAVEFVFPKNFGQVSNISQGIDQLRSNMLESMRLNARTKDNGMTKAYIITEILSDDAQGFHIDGIVRNASYHLDNEDYEISQIVRFFLAFGR